MLEGPAIDWYSRLLFGSIHCFTNPEKLFLKQFTSSKLYKNPMAILTYLRQYKGEMLREYLSHFNKICLSIKNINKQIIVYSLAGIRPGFAQKELAYRNPSSLGNLLSQVEEFITKEDLDSTQKNHFTRMDPKEKRDRQGRTVGRRRDN